MKQLRYKLQFHSYWHCGSGLAAGTDVDALVVKDKNGVPYVPGKTIKGLVRQAFEEILQFRGDENELDTNKLFGYFHDSNEMVKGELFFSNATMKEIDEDLKKYLYSSLAQTAINEKGTAERHSLRKEQVVIPCQLEGYIDNVDEDEDKLIKTLEASLRYIKRLGTNRSRGLGRCSFIPIGVTEAASGTQNNKIDVTQPLKFSCTLKSSVILNTHSASQGNNTTLDYIPGSCFLGIVANRLFPSGGETTDPEAWRIIQSSEVKFSDAHPAVIDNRAIKIPATYMLKKDVSITKAKNGDWYNTLNQNAPDPNAQYKQCREGFYAFIDGKKKVAKNKCLKSFAIKSAYNRDMLRSMDEQMYGYESLECGQKFYFTVDCPNELKLKIHNALAGIQRIGRSRSAQYGQVEIKLEDYNEPQSHYNEPEDGLTYIYADSRLVFINPESMEHTFAPSLDMLHLKEGEILWGKSQIRTFQYSPWNYKRQCFDSDRTGIEKGSVIVVKDAVFAEKTNYIGNFQNEGFGKILVNPEFLKKDKQYKFEDTEGDEHEKKDKNNEVIPYLERKRAISKQFSDIGTKVNSFVDDNSALFRDEKFKSQWSTIRAWAMRYSDADQLKAALFENGTGYLMHGKAAKKWEGNRISIFQNFFNYYFDSDRRKEYTSEAVINLAAQMSKIKNNNE